MSAPFHDYFSGQAATYAAIRPDYPPELFDLLVTLVDRRALAWDCATGSGQAAIALAPFFDRVIATDASATQIAHARSHPRIEYRVATAEVSGLPDASADLITVAQALHWFERDRFYAEARRVLVPGGVLAVWSYDNPTIDADSPLDAALQHFTTVTLGPYWPPDRGLVGAGYARIVFPFVEVPTPSFVITRAWTFSELMQYLRSWSSRARFLAQHGVDPVTPFESQMALLWGDPHRRHQVRWPVTMRVGSTFGA